MFSFVGYKCKIPVKMYSLCTTSTSMSSTLQLKSHSTILCLTHKTTSSTHKINFVLLTCSSDFVLTTKGRKTGRSLRCHPARDTSTTDWGRRRGASTVAIRRAHSVYPGYPFIPRVQGMPNYTGNGKRSWKGHKEMDKTKSPLLLFMCLKERFVSAIKRKSSSWC